MVMVESLKARLQKESAIEQSKSEVQVWEVNSIRTAAGGQGLHFHTL